MQKLVHSIALEVFMYPTEDIEKVAEAIEFIFPIKKTVEEEDIESYYGPEIIRLTADIKKSAEVRQILTYLIKKLSSADKKKILDSIADRIDDEGNVFIRFSKQDAYSDSLKLQYHGDVIKLKIKMASYPFSLEKAKENLRELFESI